MKKLSITTVLLVLITLGGLFVRVWQLGSIPNGLNRDEAALGYNAYLLGETGRDEWGHAWPVALRSFGDYKLAGSVWTMIPFIKVLGLTDWAVRLPIALAGTALVPLMYILARKIEIGPKLALVPAILVAFSPIFIFFSRFGFEAILALFWGMLAQVVWLREKPSKLTDILGILSYFLACITYNTPMLLLPVAMLMILAARGITNWQKWLLPVVGTVAAVLIAYVLVAPASNSKQAITIFSDPTIISEYPNYRAQFSGWQQTIFGNQSVYFAQLATQRLINFFTPRFLTASGGTHPWHQVPGAASHVVLPTYLLAIGGLGIAIVSILLNFSRLFTKKWWQANLYQRFEWRFIILVGVLIYALMLPSVTVDAPHATRSLFGVAILFLIVATAIARFSILLKDKKFFLKGSAIVLGVFFTWHTFSYLSTYFQTYGEKSAVMTQSGLAKAVTSSSAVDPSSDVYVVDPEGYEYIRVAWSEGLSAEGFFNTIDRDPPNTLGFTPGKQVGHYIFVRNYVGVPEGQLYFIWQENQWQKIE